MLSPLRFIPEWLFICVARPLGRGNHFSQTVHWCILDRLLDGFAFFNVMRPPRFCPLADLGAGDGLRWAEYESGFRSHVLSLLFRPRECKSCPHRRLNHP